MNQCVHNLKYKLIACCPFLEIKQIWYSVNIHVLPRVLAINGTWPTRVTIGEDAQILMRFNIIKWYFFGNLVK